MAKSSREDAEECKNLFSVQQITAPPTDDDGDGWYDQFYDRLLLHSWTKAVFKELPRQADWLVPMTNNSGVDCSGQYCPR